MLQQQLLIAVTFIDWLTYRVKFPQCNNRPLTAALAVIPTRLHIDGGQSSHWSVGSQMGSTCSLVTTMVPTPQVTEKPQETTSQTPASSRNRSSAL